MQLAHVCFRLLGKKRDSLSNRNFILFQLSWKTKNIQKRDTLVLAFFNEATCLLAGILIFSILGFMSQSTGLSIDQVSDSGPGLAFIVYPNAINKLPFAPFWYVMFFLMLLFIGLDF